MKNELNVETLGQVFTQEHTVNFMLNLCKNEGVVLEPSCGVGAFANKLKNKIAIELDKNVAPNYALNLDFFEFSTEHKFNSIIGNPPFVKFKDIYKKTKNLLTKNKYDILFDERSNLYLFFIYKCILHLNEGGELVFITPREFLKATSSIQLNNFIFEHGTITDMVDFGDARLFGNFTPNCVIWRFEKNNLSKKTNYSIASVDKGIITVSKNKEKEFFNASGQLLFIKEKYPVKFSDLFYIKVGAVSGADELFANENGNMPFVNSETMTNGKTKQYFYNIETDELKQHKKFLLKRKIKSFTEKTWYMWGRNNYESNENRIYVNCKTRKTNPFFIHSCKNYDGSILGIFPKNQNLNIELLTKDLNEVNWNELGFMCGNRFIFSQKALESSVLPKYFEKYLKKDNK